VTRDVAVFQLDADVKLPPASQLLDKLTSCLPGDCCKLQSSPLVYRNGQAQSFLTLDSRIAMQPRCCEPVPQWCYKDQDHTLGVSLQFLHVMHIISHQKIHYCTDYCLMDFVQQQGDRLIQSALDINRSVQLLQSSNLTGNLTT